jgi:uncharacterized membrane protein
VRHLYLINVTVHVLAALFWLGGMFFVAVVGAPVLRKVEPVELRTELFRQIGERFRRVGWWAIAVLLLTGIANLQFRGTLSWRALSSSGFWASPYGQALAWKLAAVGAMLIVQVAHDFFVGPAAARLPQGTAEMLLARRRAALLARISAVLGIVVVVAAVRLARGG